jgi:hypothetical protein
VTPVHVARPVSLWTHVLFIEFSNSVEDPLLDETLEESQRQSDDRRGPEPLSSSKLLMTSELRRPLVVVSSAMISQQVSGNNINF